MAAEKCGNPVAVVLAPVAQETTSNEGMFLSGKAFRVLKKIRHKFPDFSPVEETDIWIKARSMGITEEE